MGGAVQLAFQWPFLKQIHMRPHVIVVIVIVIVIVVVVFHEVCKIIVIWEKTAAQGIDKLIKFKKVVFDTISSFVEQIFVF